MPATSKTPSPRHVLVVQTWGIGDTFLTLALFKLVRDHYPAAKVTALLAFEGMGELLESSKLVDTVVVLRQGTSLAKKVRTFLALRSSKCDTAIIATRLSWAYSIFCRVVAGIPYVISDTRHPVGRMFCHDPGTDFSSHRRVANGLLLRPLIPDLTSSAVEECNIELSRGAASNEVATLLRTLSPSSRYYGIHLGSGAQPVKRVPEPVANLAIDQLAATDPTARFLYVEGPGDPTYDSLPPSLRAKMERAKGKSIADLQCILERCHSVVTGDTGISHMAASVGTHATIIVGPGDIARAHPWGKHTVVTTRTPPSCMPCYLKAPSLFGNCPYEVKCMTSVSAEDVVTAVTSGRTKFAVDES